MKLSNKQQVLLRLNVAMVKYCKEQAQQLSFDSMQDYIKSLIRDKMLIDIDK